MALALNNLLWYAIKQRNQTKPKAHYHTRESIFEDSWWYQPKEVFIWAVIVKNYCGFSSNQPAFSYNLKLSYVLKKLLIALETIRMFYLTK